MVNENVMGDSIANERTQIAAQPTAAVHGLKILVARCSQLYLPRRHPADLDTAMAAMVKKSAKAIQYLTRATILVKMF